MAKFKLTYTTSTLAARLPGEVIADSYRLMGRFFVFYKTNSDVLSSDTVVHQIAANAVLHIELEGE